jgi:hypothetical protein
VRDPVAQCERASNALELRLRLLILAIEADRKRLRRETKKIVRCVLDQVYELEGRRCWERAV